MERTSMSCIQSFCDKNITVDEELGTACFFSYKDLKIATNKFTKKIGDGGYGRVYYGSELLHDPGLSRYILIVLNTHYSLNASTAIYLLALRGKLRDKRIVAVKVLKERSQKSLEQFNNEVSLLSSLHHENLVVFYGSTKPHEKLLLVYEFVPNGTLAYHLYDQEDPLPLTLRIRMAIETAEGLSYLHTAEPQIIHRDVKSENILLDGALHVKVADFGLCRLLPLDNKDLCTLTPGTMGYNDPEYRDVFTVTAKSDVYSFGVVLMELLTRKKAVDVNRPRDEIYLYNMVLNKQMELLVDRGIGYDLNDDTRMVIDSVASLARQCLQPTGDQRPTMVEVLTELKRIQSEMQRLMVVKGTKISYCESVTIYKYKELKKATSSFSQVIGFNSVYYGKLPDGREVAVKTLSGLENEVAVLSKYRHENLVVLYGHTNLHDSKRFLVYEFVPNGTLWDHLHGGMKPHLSWRARINIAIDTAEGISYLHTDEPLVIHHDVTTSNILLDNDFQAKVSGFSLCRPFPSGIMQVITTRVVGTMGYIDPEYVLLWTLSEKSDVYNFGVVLTELITGQKAADVRRNPDEIYLYRTVVDKIRNNQMEELVDPTLEYDTDGDVRRMIDGVGELVLQCLKEQGKDRPLMVDILKALKGIKDGHS